MNFVEWIYRKRSNRASVWKKSTRKSPRPRKITRVFPTLNRASKYALCYDEERKFGKINKIRVNSVKIQNPKPPNFRNFCEFSQFILTNSVFKNAFLYFQLYYFVFFKSVLRTGVCEAARPTWLATKLATDSTRCSFLPVPVSSNRFFRKDDFS